LMCAILTEGRQHQCDWRGICGSLWEFSSEGTHTSFYYCFRARIEEYFACGGVSGAYLVREGRVYYL
jgi:hypothetical protein